MNALYKKVNFVTLPILGFFLLLPLHLTLAVDYQTMVSIPGVTDTGSLTFGSYVNILYNLAIVGAALLAVIQLVLAGAMYMASDANVSSKGVAIAKIQGALVGLLIIISAYIILNEINDQLLELEPFTNIVPTNVTGVNMMDGRTTVIADPADLVDYIDPSDQGVPTLDDYRDLPQERVLQFVNNCYPGEVFIIGDDMTCRNNIAQATAGNVVNTANVLNLLPSGLDEDEVETRTNQYSNYIAPYEPGAVVPQNIIDYINAENDTTLNTDDLFFIVQQDLLITNPLSAGAESQQEAFCGAIGGTIVQGGVGFRACVREL